MRLGSVIMVVCMEEKFLFGFLGNFIVCYVGFEFLVCLVISIYVGKRIFYFWKEKVLLGKDFLKLNFFMWFVSGRFLYREG